MEFWYALIGIAAVFALFPYIRCFFKRLKCANKIKWLCRSKNYKTHVTHPLWFLGSKHAKKCDLYIVSMGENANIKAAEIATDLRSEGMCVQFDTVGRGLKPQMKYANKIGALYTLVLGDSELETGNIKLKNMETGNETEMTLSDFAENFQSVVIKDAMSGFESLGMEGIDLASLMGGTI